MNYENKIINYDSFDFSNSTIIKPQIASENVQYKLVYTRVVIDSRHRNVDLYPNPASFTIPLNDLLDNIISVELLSAANIPFCDKNINAYNNLLSIKVYLNNDINNIIIG
jgi:hypothetical protein